MKTRKEMKTRAKHSLKEHYGIFVVLCLIAAFIGSEYGSSITALQETITVESSEGGVYEDVDGEQSQIVTDPVGTVNMQAGFEEILGELIMGNVDAGKEMAEQHTQNEVEQSKTEKNAVLGRSRGVLSMIVNGVTSGSFFVSFAVGIRSIVGSDSFIIGVCIFISLMLLMLIWVFIVDLYPVIMARMFMEGKTYEKVHTHRALFLFKVRKWFHVGIVMLVKSIYHFLWWLTIVGGIIKIYSYRMVPYILAENPTLKAKEAITLSRKMMYGHKWECFVFELSFIWWNILGILTFGISAILFSNPYQSAAFVEYYEELRRLAKDNKIENSDKLSDEYLYVKPAKEKIQQAYEDVIVELSKPEVKLVELTGFKKFLANVFGLTIGVGKEEADYEKDQNRRIGLNYAKDAVEGKVYPTRLTVIPEKHKRKWIGTINYVRHYSIYSVIMMFFVFSLIGWIWEVSLHLVSDGVFVNRGVMHGPWLPIYGAGGVMILVLLNKFRKNPPLEFITAVILCGFVEYFTSYYLEITHDGTKWWDYSGYFLNLNGRICAEGLLVFGLGGMAIVYLAAPFFDNMIRRIPLKAIIILDIVLVLSFTTDVIYSKQHPNMGKGITDYTGAYLELEESEKRENQIRLKKSNLLVSIKA